MLALAEGPMAEHAWAERRQAMRVPVRGVAVFYAEDGAVHGRIENLSESGALVSLATSRAFETDLVDVELKLGVDTGWVSARAVRVERTRSHAQRWHVAVAFDRVDDSMRNAIEAAIGCALRAAQRKPVLVVDERLARRRDLAARLGARGLTPLVPKTPLEAVDLLARAQLHVAVCLVAPSFGQSAAELRTFVTDAFPWVSTADISDDLDATVDRAVAAWAGTDVGRLGVASA
jgi:hypothetical protein